MANAKINLSLPPELWDPILEFLPIRELEKIKLLSFFFYKLINLNRGFKCKILLCKNKQENLKIPKQAQWAAENGHLKVLKWLHSTFELTREDAINNYIFYRAALGGHLKVLKWVHLTFKLAREDVRSDGNIAFQFAALNGHLEVLKWIHSIFELTEEDVRGEGNLAFYWAAENGHFEILNWLYSTFSN